MSRQHAAGNLPGADGLLEGPEGSIAAAARDFLEQWIETQPVAPRRAYERTLTFLLRDLAENGPMLDSPVRDLTSQRLDDHLSWRSTHGLDDAGELKRTRVHLRRFAAFAGISEPAAGD